jgi:N-acetylglutamate synthase-like GNAT family acetyltransferase
MFSIRQAVKEDHQAIRVLILQARINPLGLDWQRFLVAEDQDGELIGCGQVKQHRDSSRELASIAVKEQWRRRGVASQLILSLKAQHGPPLWLICRPDLRPFYKRHGFVEDTTLENLPSHYRGLFQLIRLFRWLRIQGQIIAVMVWPTKKDGLKEKRASRSMDRSKSMGQASCLIEAILYSV